MATETKKKATTAAVKAPRAKKVKEEGKEVAAEETTVAASTETKGETTSNGEYIFAVGRRKTSIARVKLVKNGKGKITINGRPVDEYFTTFELLNAVKLPLKTSGQETALDVVANVEGGGIHGQSEAVRLGMSRALIELNPTFRKTLKKLGFLTRDPRAKERKKPGLRKARRAPQWSKR